MKRRIYWSTSVAALMVLGLAGCQTASQVVRPDASEIDKSPLVSTDGGADGHLVGISTGDAISLESGAAANPTRFGPLESRTDMLLRRFYSVDRSTCDGYVSRGPGLIIDAPNGFEHLKITAHGDVDVLFVELPDLRFHCARDLTSAPTIDSQDWPAGTYRVFVGSLENRQDLVYELTVEDLGSPATLPWLDGTMPTVTLTGSPDKPTLVTRTFEANEPKTRHRRHGKTECLPTQDGLRFLQNPDLRLDVAQTAEVLLSVRSDVPGAMTLVGPLPEDNRDIPMTCVPSTDADLTLVKGTYFVRYGTPQGRAPTVVNFAVSTPGGELDPLATFASARSGAPESVIGRRLSLHMPYLNTDRALPSDAVREKLFINAPKSLYVAAAQNLNAETAQPLVRLDESEGEPVYLEANPSFTYPVENELLLLLDDTGLVLAADGSLFRVEPDSLKVVQLTDTLVLPKQARNPHLQLPQAIALAGESETRSVQEHTARHERYKTCTKAAWDRVQARLDKLQEDAAKNREAIDTLRTQTDTAARRSCNEPALRADDRRTWQQLETNRTKRREAALNTIRAKVSEHFTLR